MGEQLAGVPPGKQLPLRRGERRMTLTMPAAYTPSAPTGAGTDDYRCFLLDPGLDRDVWLTGSNVLPGNPRVVHHVILFRIPREKVAEAESLDDTAPGEGWTRFGGAGNTNSLLHLLCGTEAEASATTACTRFVNRPMTVLDVAGHMHLLGRSLRIEVDPDTPEARTILDIPIWDFDDQQVHPIRPVHLDAGDTVRITCRHVQWLRDVLPAFASSREDRYVIWAEGSTDEMCLGMLQVAFEGA